MYSFTLNNEIVRTDLDVSLLYFLREVKNICSVKNGCSEGACGTCMVLVDEQAKRACILKTSKLNGKKITTVEGLSPSEKEIYSVCFANAGAVQCGFCTPGMVISAKALLDKNPDPSRSEIKVALRGNICRCTGYKKIEDAVLSCAKCLREGTIPTLNENMKIGKRAARLDAIDKALGTGLYTDDLRFPNMCYGKALRTKHPRAKILSIDIEQAKNHPDAIAIFTAKDIDGKKEIGHLVKDWSAMIAVGEVTRYLGDSLALVVSEKQESLNDILSLIQVEYEIYKPMTSPKESMKEDAPFIHPTGNLLRKEVLKRGDADAALTKSAHVVIRHFSTPFTEHAFLETECAVAMPEGEDGVLVYTSSQSIYDEQRELSELLGIDKEKVHVKSMYVGGGFGGKEDMSVQHHAAFLAFKTKRCVKVLFSRKESMLIHPKRHAAEMDFTVGCDENGILQAMKATIITDTGAYASLGGPVLQRACTHAAGPYNYQNVEITGLAYYTNNPPAGAFRGFGVTQSVFAMESVLNELAEKVGISPWEIRYKNAIRPGQVLPNGQIADQGTALEETLLAVKDAYESAPIAGIACAMKNAGLGVGVPDVGRCILKVANDFVEIRTAAACIGQGLATVLLQIFCELTDMDPKQVIVQIPDTTITPNSGTTTASRQTLFTGEACRRATLQFLKAVKNKSLKDLEGMEFYGEFKGETDAMNSDKPYPVSHVAYGYATQVVILDEFGKVVKVIAAHDVGKAINPNGVEGQIEGGVVMGLGYALTEDFPLTEGLPTAKYGTLGLFRADQAPEIESIIVEKNDDPLAFGAKGIGEITTIPTAPAVQGAYLKFDGIFRSALPLEKTYYNKKK